MCLIKKNNFKYLKIAKIFNLTLQIIFIFPVSKGASK